ncbi:hypothetical protein Ahy_A02g009136 [Arachis hypogaea]|uniref:Uncharacterized protein n=1 Tax=Arachis hypogaea TaxID=3818 RepID=A0A445EFX5_ARAHY|nr:hypothetical protein Ahy_A02g009136 [Arachis hypogaea]
MYILTRNSGKSKYNLDESKNVKRRYTHIKNSHDKPLLEPRKSEELTEILHCVYDNAMVEMQEHKAKRKEKCSLSHDDASLENINELQSPPRQMAWIV